MTPQPQQDKDLDIIRDYIIMSSDWEAQQEMALDALHRIRSRPAPSQDLEQTVIEELLAIEGYVNGIRSGDESPKRMCDYISSSIGVIRHVIKKLESLRTQEPKRSHDLEYERDTI